MLVFLFEKIRKYIIFSSINLVVSGVLDKKIDSLISLISVSGGRFQRGGEPPRSLRDLRGLTCPADPAGVAAFHYNP